MKPLNQLLATYGKLSQASMPVKAWQLFVRALTFAFVVYWLHLRQHLDDWLGSGGFHLTSSASDVFAPLSSPFPQLLWWATLIGSLLMSFQRTMVLGALSAGLCFFYATMCDPASTGALNMHFIFALAIIFWSASQERASDVTMSAWPAHLLRLYLVVIYFGSGWRKAIYGDWLTNPESLRHCITGFYTTDLTRWLYPILPTSTWTIAQYITIAFELGAPLLLLYPPFRKVGLILGCLLHLGIALLMKDLFYFSLQMVTFYIPFLIPISYFPDGLSKKDHQLAI